MISCNTWWFCLTVNKIHFYPFIKKIKIHYSNNPEKKQKQTTVFVCGSKKRMILSFLKTFFFLKIHKSNSVITYSSIHIKSSSRCGSMNLSMIYLLLLVSCTSSPAPRATLSVLGTELLVLLEIPPKQWHNTQHSLSLHCP